MELIAIPIGHDNPPALWIIRYELDLVTIISVDRPLYRILWVAEGESFNFVKQRFDDVETHLRAHFIQVNYLVLTVVAREELVGPVLKRLSSIRCPAFQVFIPTLKDQLVLLSHYLVSLFRSRDVDIVLLMLICYMFL